MCDVLYILKALQHPGYTISLYKSVDQCDPAHPPTSDKVKQNNNVSGRLEPNCLILLILLYSQQAPHTLVLFWLAG